MTDTQETKPAKPKINPWLKIALELGPIVVFFIANFRAEWLVERFPALGDLGGPLFIATALFMVATAISLTVSWFLMRTIPAMPLVSGVVVFVFGVLTLWLQNDIFVKMKPTIINSMFGALLLGGYFIFKTSLLKYVFDTAFRIDDEGWNKLTVRWGIYFFVVALLNEIVWRGLVAWFGPGETADDYWVYFRAIGLTAIAFIFVMSQMPLLMRHSLEEDEDSEAAN